MRTVGLALACGPSSAQLVGWRRWRTIRRSENGKGVVQQLSPVEEQSAGPTEVGAVVDIATSAALRAHVEAGHGKVVWYPP